MVGAAEYRLISYVRLCTLTFAFHANALVWLKDNDEGCAITPLFKEQHSTYRDIKPNRPTLHPSNNTYSAFVNRCSNVAR